MTWSRQYRTYRHREGEPQPSPQRDMALMDRMADSLAALAEFADARVDKKNLLADWEIKMRCAEAASAIEEWERLRSR